MKTKLLTLLLLVSIMLIPLSVRADMDDSSLFMDAFTAYQRKDYLLSVEKLNKLTQFFPDSPLRDVSLLMLSRSHQRSGDNEAAARTVNLFFSEFSGNAIAASVEDELINLSKRQKNGEKLVMNRQLRLAAQKVRADQQAHERAVAEKIERERLARERADRERIERERAEAERREQKRLAALKAERDAVKFDFEPIVQLPVVSAGAKAVIPFTLANRSMNTEEFLLAAPSPSGAEAAVATAQENPQPVRTVKLKPKEMFRGTVSFPVPADLVDGSRMSATIKATSVKFNDIGQQQVIQSMVSAPLLRVVSRMEKPQAKPGEQISYKVSLLNAGSQEAREVDLRITLPASLKLLNAGDSGCWIENEQTAACRISSVPQGTMNERSLTVMVRDGAEEAKVRAIVDLVQTVLQLKQSFQSSPFAIVKP